MSAVVVERTIDYFGENGVERGSVRVFEPKPDQDDWRCEYQMSWPGFDRTKYAIGIDAWQALYLAMFIVPSVISSTDGFKAGRIGLWGTKAQSFEHLCHLFGVPQSEGYQQ